mmetsp:Transcript_10712/g.19040  ORF Transcript_10712/g.19040 Transcript_10712/m.19040 type:complete len:220 (-) Transcript_10712:30-689(-)
MGEEAHGHEIVRLQCSFQVPCMDATGRPHDHVLRALHNLAMHPQQIGLLKCLEAEVVIPKVTIEVHGSIQCLCIRLDEFPNLVRDQCSRPSLLVHVGVQVSAGLHERVGGALVQVRNGNSGSQGGEIRMALGHVGACLSRQGINLCCGDAVVETLNDFLRDGHWIHKLAIKPFAQVPNAFRDVVKLHLLALSVALQNIHCCLCHCPVLEERDEAKFSAA